MLDLLDGDVVLQVCSDVCEVLWAFVCEGVSLLAASVLA